jgi:hypothetical protein
MFCVENTHRGNDGFTTHLMTWTFCLSFSKFLGDRPFFLQHEVPASTPPEYATNPDFRDKYGVLLRSPRSLVSNLLDMPCNRVFEIDQSLKNRLHIQLLFSHFATTDEIKNKFQGSPVWDFFSFGRIGKTREEFQSYDLIQWTHTSCTNLSVFYWLRPEEKKELLASCEMRFTPEIESFAADVIGELGRFYSAHTRLGDFRRTYALEKYGDVDLDRYRGYIAANFVDDSLPIVIATDSLHERELFEMIFEGRKFIFLDEFIFDNYRDRFLAMEWHDFNVLTVINQLIAAAGETFIGTYRSTFSGIIHRLRQERYGYKDFNFFPDERVSLLLNDEMKIVPDRSGFFHWNRFSQFMQDHESMAWRREWDFDLSSVPI